MKEGGREKERDKERRRKGERKKEREGGKEGEKSRRGREREEGQIEDLLKTKERKSCFPRKRYFIYFSASMGTN